MNLQTSLLANQIFSSENDRVVFDHRARFRTLTLRKSPKLSWFSAHRVHRVQSELGCLRNAIETKVILWKLSKPREYSHLTGQLVLFLSQKSSGYSKSELLLHIDRNYKQRSFQYILSLEVALNKRIQRARKKIREFGIDIRYDKSTRLWSLSNR